MINFTLPLTKVNNIRNYKPFLLKGLRYLAGLYNWYGHCDPSQTSIAKQMGTCRKTANQSIKKFREDGILSVVGRYQDTSIYNPGPIFTDIKYRDQLSNVILELKGFPIFKLFISAFGYTNINIVNQIKHSHVQFDSVKSKQWPFQEWMSDLLMDVDDEKITKEAEAWFMGYQVFAERQDAVLQSRTTVPLQNESKKQPKKREHEMYDPVSDNATPNIVPQYIIDICEFNLSHAQQLELIEFAPSTISHARSKLRTRSDIAHPFPFFLKICQSHAANQSSPDNNKQQNVYGGKYNQTSSSRSNMQKKEPGERVPEKSDLWYAKEKMARLSWILQNTKPEKYRNLLQEQIEFQKQKIEKLEHLAHTPSLRDADFSWIKPLEELNAMKEEGLVRVSDIYMKKELSDLFDNCIKNAARKYPEEWAQLNDVNYEKPVDIDLEENERAASISFVDFPSEIECNENDYEEINTHSLFDSH